MIPNLSILTNLVHFRFIRFKLGQIESSFESNIELGFEKKVLFKFVKKTGFEFELTLLVCVLPRSRIFVRLRKRSK